MKTFLMSTDDNDGPNISGRFVGQLNALHESKSQFSKLNPVIDYKLTSEKKVLGYHHYYCTIFWGDADTAGHSSFHV